MRGKRFGFDVGWVFSGSLFVLVLGFIRRPIMAYYVGAEGLGLWAMLFGIVSLFYMTDLGIPAAATKYAAQYKDEKEALHQIVSTSLLLSLGLGTTTAVVLFMTGGYIAAFFSMPSLAPFVRLFTFSIPFYYVFRSMVANLSGLREMKKVSFLNSLFGLSTVVLTVVPLILGFNLRGAVIGYVGATIISACAAFFWLTQAVPVPVRVHSEPAKRLILFGVQAVVANIGAVIQYEIDTLMIGYFMTPTEVGIYSVSSSIAKAIWMIPQAINTVSYPTFSYYWEKKDFEAVKVLFDKCIKYAACMLMPIGVGLVFFGEFFILLVFEHSFVSAVLPLKILLLGAVVKGTWISVGSIFSAVGRVDLGYKFSPIMIVTNVVMNYLCIPVYGIEGAAIATTLSFFSILGVSAYMVKRIVHVEYDVPWIGKAAILTLSAIALFYVLAMVMPFYVAGVAVLGVYVASLYMILLKKEDRQYIRDMVDSVRNRQ